MIINNNKGEKLFGGNEHRIAFAINTEGINTEGIAGEIARRYWPQLASIGKSELGTVITKDVDGITFYGLVCYSIEKGWQNQTETIRQCFNAIETDEPIAATAIGRGLYDLRRGANASDIRLGMEQSDKKIIIY